MRTITLKLKNEMLIIGLLMITVIGYSQTYTTTGSFSAPAGVTAVQVEAWGGGGAGGGNTTSKDGGGGGGGGAYAKSTALLVSYGTTYTVTVGTGGTGSTAAGGDGKDSWFNTSGTILAKGGAGGNPPISGLGGIAGAGGSSLSSIGTTKFSGGNGGTGKDNNTGQGGPGGSSAGTALNGVSGDVLWSTVTAASAPTGGAIGGNGGTAGNNGANGTVAGGAGGGAGDGNKAGGNGANGKVVISYACPTYALTAAATSNGPFCSASNAVVTFYSSSMVDANYKVTYTLTGATTGGATIPAVAFSGGALSFTTPTLNPGNTTVTITNISNTALSGTCSNAITANNTVIVNVYNATANSGTAISTCTTVGAVNITAGSSATNYSSTTWTSSGTGTFTDANSLTLATYSPSAADITAGNVTLTLTATALSPCTTDAVSTKILTINQVAVAVAGSTIFTCSTSGAINITAGSSATNQTAVLWSSSGTGTFANATSLTNCTYNPSAADITAGSVTLTLTAINAGCGNDTSTKTLTIYATPTITGTTPVTRTGIGTVILGASASVGTLYWYAAATGGSPIGFGSSFTTPSISVTTTYYVGATNGTCSSSVRTPVTATVIYPEIDITGNNVSIVDGDTTPSTTDWTDFGATNSTRTFFVKNTGSGTLNIGSVIISGTDANQFTVSTPSTNIASGSYTTFTVTFSPTSAGIKLATLTIANNDLDENPYFFSIKATAIDREINITGNNVSIVDGDTTPSLADYTDFSTVAGTRTYTIRNSGNVPLHIGSITIGGANAADFAVTTMPGLTVPAYSAADFIITFSPSAINLRTATVYVTNDDSDEAIYDFAIAGFGIIPEIDVQGNGTSIVDGDTTPSTTDWTNFGSANVTRTFTIQNQGNTLLTIGAITITGTNASEFTVTTPPSATVSAFGSTTFVVTFAPTTTGTRTATINIVNNDSNENPYDFALKGTGVAQEIDIQGNSTSIVDGDTTPTTLDWTDFTTVALTRTFTIFNTGNIPLTLGATTFSGGQSGDFSVTSVPTSPVPAFGSTTFTITFTQSGTGTRATTLQIANNDSNENPYDFKIQATGGTPEINIKSQYNVNIVDGDTTPSTTDQTDLGSVSMDGGTVLINLVIENTGTGALSIGAATFTGTDAADFTIDAAPNSVIAAGASSRFKIRFSPTSVGIKTATFSIVNNDSNENPYNFDLTGMGVQTYKDTDGDGIPDNKDGDDDNDGIIDTKEQGDGLSYPLASSVTYTFLNETFGAGTTRGEININTPDASCTYCYEDGYGSECEATSDLQDGEYTVNYMISVPGSPSDPKNIASWASTNWTAQTDHTGDTNGRMAIFNASYDPGTFYEARIDGVIPNVPITYSFWALNIMSKAAYGGTILPNITVEFVDLSNNLISSYNTGDIGRCGSTTADNTCAISQWKQYTTSAILGNVSSFIVRFKNNATGGNGNDLAIDDIKITQNYLDTDGDGIANIFDLDDDNDGIPDIEEAGFKAMSNGLSKMDTAAATWSDNDNNGINDSIDAMIAGGTYMIPDTDGDGVPNYLDLDSDNDSLFDVDEANTLNGDGDINGDGKGDLVDTDKDGILDLYDNKIGFGTNVRPYAQDTNGDGIPNYLDLNSSGIINDIQTGLYGSLDANNDGKIDGNIDIDKDGILDTFDTNTAVIGSPRDLNRKLYLDFDGRNDYGQGTTLLGGMATVSIMSWIDLATGYNTNGAIVGQDNFYLRVNAAKQLQVVMNGTAYTYPTTVLNTSQWYHVAATLGGGFLKLYLNGVSQSFTMASSIATDTNPLTIGRTASTSTNFFKGKLDEIRIFNTNLTDEQLQRVVYQEIQNTSSQTRGAIIPKDVGSLPWSNLLRYYRMDAYKDDIIDDLTTSSIDTGSGMRIYNNKYIRVQQAPMPFVTERTGDIATAVDSPTNDVRGLDAMDQDWSIIQVKHDITEPGNNVDLGMIIDAGVTAAVSNDNKFQNDWYLLLNGKLDLQGKSQLVQTINSDLDVTSAGSIERDQQGQSNKYNYNYWSSPVGTMSTTSNNNGFTVADVMKDGTDPALPQNITWTSSYDSAPTTPITLSSYWIFKFQNVSPIYANWSAVGPNATLGAAMGYTMKGSSAATATQNYTFVGKPNNGTITNPIAANNANLSGNPYPSAIDAYAFIDDNITSTTGALYLWEHFATNTSHNLIEYQGGYATVTKLTATPPVAPVGISNAGSSTRTQKRFIPVGQGFLVYGSATGGTITFKNSQRGFVKEDNAALSNPMFRQPTGPTTVNNNSDDEIEEKNYSIIRLGFDAANHHRQIAMGFTNSDEATEGYDPGYDGQQIDNQPNECSFVNGTYRLAIQGDGYFATNKSYPLGVKTAAEGNVKFSLDGIEKFDENQEIYIYDSTTDLYHDIRNEAFEINIPSGTVIDRFSLRFKDAAALSTNNPTIGEDVSIIFTNVDNMLSIKNDKLNFKVISATLFNMLGQSIENWDVQDQDQSNIQIPVKNVSTGTYIVKVHTTKGDISKKIIIK